MPESKGKIVWIGDIQVVTDTFKKREFAITVSAFHPETGEEFTHDEAFQVMNDRISVLDNIQINDKVKVGFQVRSNRSEKDDVIRYFTNLNAFKIEVLEKAKAETGETVHQDNNDDGLPF
jgi:hypothetical protein